MSTALWTGVSVAELLHEVGARGDHVTFHATDNYAESAPVTELLAAGALIALGMNGETLPREHGYPARVILPGVYGFKSVKWLTRLEVTAEPYAGLWHIHGWTDTAHIQTTTRIDVAHRQSGRLTVAGVAFAGRRGIRAVEVRVNGGRWRRATLGPRIGKQTWVQWATVFKGSMPARIEARAVDGNGTVQSAEHRGAYPDGSSGWASVDT
jgi:DMSO/TMAO reductase YedYZ molybdopterin-dependent catalytic subunit